MVGKQALIFSWAWLFTQIPEDMFSPRFSRGTILDIVQKVNPELWCLQ